MDSKLVSSCSHFSSVTFLTLHDCPFLPAPHFPIPRCILEYAHERRLPGPKKACPSEFHRWGLTTCVETQTCLRSSATQQQEKTGAVRVGMSGRSIRDGGRDTPGVRQGRHGTRRPTATVRLEKKMKIYFRLLLFLVSVWV